MYHCTFCRADGELPRCSNCGAPADRMAVPVVVPFDPNDPYGQRAHFAAVACRPRINDPFDDEENAYAREWLADHRR